MLTHIAAKLRDSGDYGIVRKSSDPGSSSGSTKGRTSSADQGASKYSEPSSSMSSSTRSRGESVDHSARDTRRPSEPVNKLSAHKVRSDRYLSPYSPLEEVANIYISMMVGGKEYRKLSKSTNDAGRSAHTPSSAPPNVRSVSSSMVLPSKRVNVSVKRESSKEKQLARSQDRSPAKTELYRSKDHKYTLPSFRSRFLF